MKRPLLFLVLLSIFSSSCSNLEIIETPSVVPTIEKTSTATSLTSTATPSNLVDIAETIQILPQEYIENNRVFPSFVSPDGKYIIVGFSNFGYDKESSSAHPTITIMHKSQLIESQFQVNTSPFFYRFLSWSPNSSAFAGVIADVEVSAGSDACCGKEIVIIKVVNGDIKTSVYRWEWFDSPNISWSPDGEKMAIGFPRENKVHIVDRDGNLLQSFNTEKLVLFWANDLLFFVDKGFNPKGLYAFDLSTQVFDSIIDDLNNKSYLLHNNMFNQVFLTEPDARFPSVTSRKYYILDVETKVIKEIKAPDSKDLELTNWVSSPAKDFVALKYKENSLWIFNWHTYEFKYYGQIKDLFGWYKNNDGFLVTTLDGEQKIIKP